MRLPVTIRRFSAQGLSRRKLPLTAAPNLRIAQIAKTASFDSAKAFPQEHWVSLEDYRPQVLVATAADLLQLAQRVDARTLELSSVDHAIFALTHCGDEPLSDVTRVLLWQAFGVPVYELFIGRGGILAAECEANDGWHVDAGANFRSVDNELVFDGFGAKGTRTGLSGYVETAACACGRPGSRLMDVTSCSAPQQRLAATA